MRAAVVKGPGSLAIETLPDPEPRPGEVRVRVTACGICGTDLHFHHGGLWPVGATPGHELAGVVDALGDGVLGFETGEAVAIEPLQSCGGCRSCRVGREATCDALEVFGIHRPGGMAELLCVPAKRLFRLPAGLAPGVAALAEPMAVVVHGVRRGRLQPGQRVLVLGAGTIGLLSVLAARALGAGEVWLTARHPHQAEVGRSLGASRVLREPEATVEALDGMGREAPIDLVVETVGGAADTLSQAAAAVAPGGCISVVGVFMGPIQIDGLRLFLREADLAFSNCYVHPEQGADFETAVELVGNQRSALAAVATQARPLDDVSRAFEVASDKRAGALKVTLIP